MVEEKHFTVEGKQQDAGGTETPNQKSSGNGRIFTEADFNSTVANIRRKEQARYETQLELVKQQEREKAIADWKAENGLDDDVINKLQEADKSKTEFLKTQHQLNKLQQERDLLFNEKTDAEQRLNEYIIRNALTSEAIRQHSNDPDVVYTMLKNNVAVENNGNLLSKDGSTIEEMVKFFLNAKPHLVSPQIHLGADSKGGDVSGEKKLDLSSPTARKEALRLFYQQQIK